MLRSKLLSQRAVNPPKNEVMTHDEIIDVDTNNTFYERYSKDKNTSSFYNHRSFLLKDNQFIQDPVLNTCKKKPKKSKIQKVKPRKTHTKGNNSVYMKDFEKLMKERTRAENKSLKRMKIYENTDTITRPQNVYAMPINNPKTVKKSKKSIADISNKQVYHKRVKSNQIYSVKLLL